MRSIAASRVSACPSATTISVLSPAARVMLVCNTAHGSSPAPTVCWSWCPRASPAGLLGPAVAAEELGAVGSPRRLPPTHVEEGDASAELGVPRVRRQQRLGLRFGFGDDPRCAGTTRRSEHPLGVCGDRQPPRSPGSVLHREHGQLHRRVRLDELDEVELNAAVEVLEAAVSGPMACDVGRFRASNRLRGRTPELAAVVVADVQRLAPADR